MAYNTKYQQKAYIIIMYIKIDVNILCHNNKTIVLWESTEAVVLFRRSLVRKLTIDGNELRRLALR